MRQPILSTAYLAHVIASQILGGAAPDLSDWLSLAIGDMSTAVRSRVMREVSWDMSQLGYAPVEAENGKTTWE